jgi:hypothetical protein
MKRGKLIKEALTSDFPEEYNYVSATYTVTQAEIY